MTDMQTPSPTPTSDRSGGDEPVREKKAGLFRFRLPTENLTQDEEWFDVCIGGEWKSFRVHDYDALYSVPGLYEALVYELLDCRSVTRLSNLMKITLEDHGADPSDLRVLEIGAGNGCMAEELRNIGVDWITGVDILPEARAAMKRDRPHTYDAYIVDDLTKPADKTQAHLEKEFNCLTVVAALGFGDIPPKAFATAFNAISDEGWVAMTIKEDFLATSDSSGYSGMLGKAIDAEAIRPKAQARIRHRKSLAGEPLFYTAMVGQKIADLPIA